jgi:hypothetical protein
MVSVKVDRLGAKDFAHPGRGSLLFGLEMTRVASPLATFFCTLFPICEPVESRAAIRMAEELLWQAEDAKFDSITIMAKGVRH